MSAQDTFFSDKISQFFDQNSGGKLFGILNVTPDSFFDGGRYLQEKVWLKRVEEMIGEGADVIDVGAYSSRPGAMDISIKEEIARLIPVVTSINKRFPDAIISVDTFRSEVAEESLTAGARIINDIGGGTLDEKMFDFVVKYNVPYVLMHIKGAPQTMQQSPSYSNVVEEVRSYFEKAIHYFSLKKFNNIILDPGFGFGKTLEHNYTLLGHLDQFNSLGFPVMAGLSRKSMITKVLNVSAEDALAGTIALNTIALLKGAKFLRVHDVKEGKDVIRIVDSLKGNSQTAQYS